MFGGTRKLQAELVGKDNLSKTFDGAGKSAGKLGDKLKTVAKIGATALLALAAAAIKFGADSVKAASEAQQAQTRLEDAYKRFPKLANGSIGALRKLNEQMALKTRFDDDSLASGQAVLAQFGLTHKQLKDITPLVADYAAKTGKEFPDASKAFGKAMLGNTRALKELGIDIELTGNKTKDYELIQDALNKKVGGFAEKEGKTFAGQQKILSNQFSELQEKVGMKLIPVLSKLFAWLLTKGLPALQKFGAWIGPRLGAAVAFARAGFEKFRRALSGNGQTMADLRNIGEKLKAGWIKMQPVVEQLGKVYLFQLKVVFGAIAIAIRAVIRAVSQAMTDFGRFADKVESVVNRIKGAWAKLPNFKVSLGTPVSFPGQAEGGHTVRSGWSWVGERGPELMHMDRGATVLPLDKLPTTGGGGGGGGITINITGVRAVATKRELAQEIVNALNSAGYKFGMA